MISNKIGLITSMITNLKTTVANHLEESIVMRLCQISKVDKADKNDIREILNETIYNWKWMLKEDRELSKTKVGLVDMGYKIDNNNLVGALEPICRKMVIEKKMLTLIEKAQIGNNRQIFVLCDIIKIQLLFNYLQRIIVKEIFYYAITLG